GRCLSRVYEAVRKNGKYKGVNFPGTSPPALKEERAKVIDAIISHLEESMKDLERDSPISRFRAFDPSSWPKCEKSDLSACVQFGESGQDDVKGLTEHFSGLLCREGIRTEDILTDFQSYKAFAQSRSAVPMRDTFLNILMSGRPNSCSQLTLWIWSGKFGAAERGNGRQCGKSWWRQ
ncbi:hypothetical protein IRJ41_024955, partial [Triplophysa rosa]